MIRSRIHAGRGFTLIEILLASVVAAMILAALYGVFQRAIKLRDSATQRIRDSRLRIRAADVIRNDLRNAYISGGQFASIVEGDTAGTDGLNSSFPGYLKFTTTTAKDTDDDLYGDVEQVEYYVVSDTNGASLTGGGELVRTVTRELLNTDTIEPATQDQGQQILSGVQSLQVSFYDGATWQTSWSFDTSDSTSSGSTGSSTSSNSSSSSTSSSSSSSSAGNGTAETLPVAIRVDIQMAPTAAGASTPPPLEIMVPWTTQPFTSPTPAPSASPS
jgi:prepilin-type N-terminal cleavage/methylation domain-containing protein